MSLLSSNTARTQLPLADGLICRHRHKYRHPDTPRHTHTYTDTNKANTHWAATNRQITTRIRIRTCTLSHHDTLACIRVDTYTLLTTQTSSAKPYSLLPIHDNNNHAEVMTYVLSFFFPAQEWKNRNLVGILVVASEYRKFHPNLNFKVTKILYRLFLSAVFVKQILSFLR